MSDCKIHIGRCKGSPVNPQKQNGPPQCLSCDGPLFCASVKPFKAYPWLLSFLILFNADPAFTHSICCKL